jgi:hypothetical protein
MKKKTRKAKPRRKPPATAKKLQPENIRAMGIVYYAAMLEETKMFQVVDRIVEQFQTGVLPIGSGTAGSKLFNYWKNAPQRLSETDRRNFYARVLGVPGGDGGAQPNQEFAQLWTRFVSSVSDYSRQKTVSDLLKTSASVKKSGRDLAANLSLYGFGFTNFMAVELKKEITNVINILSDPEIRNSHGVRDMWQLIDQISKLDLGGAVNINRFRTMATSGSTIINWLGKNWTRLDNRSNIPILKLRKPRKKTASNAPLVNPDDNDLIGACERWLRLD